MRQRRVSMLKVLAMAAVANVTLPQPERQAFYFRRRADPGEGIAKLQAIKELHRQKPWRWPGARASRRKIDLPKAQRFTHKATA
jgi:hypothetical protein